MGMRFRKSIKLSPGVKLNLGKKSGGISFGTKGLRYSINSSGRRTSTVGIPGTGLSFTSSSGGSRSKSRKKYTSSKQRTAQIKKEREKAAKDKEKQKQLDMELAKATVEEYEAHIDAIRSIHKDCDDYVDWEHIYSLPEPFQAGSAGPKEAKALADREAYKPGFIAKRIKFFDVTDIKDQNIEKAREEDKKDYDSWKSLHDTAEKILSGDTDYMLAVIEDMAPLDDLVEFGSGFEIGVVDKDVVEVDFHVMADTIVPKEAHMLTSTGKLSTKALGISKRLDIMQDYVCSCTIRIARDMFALLPVKYVIVNAMDTFIDTGTGYTEPKCILSVVFTRDKLNALNFDAIDPSDSMANFQHNMSFLKTKGFKPVPMIRKQV